MFNSLFIWTAAIMTLLAKDTVDRNRSNPKEEQRDVGRCALRNTQNPSKKHGRAWAFVHEAHSPTKPTIDRKRILHEVHSPTKSTMDRKMHLKGSRTW